MEVSTRTILEKDNLKPNTPFQKTWRLRWPSWSFPSCWNATTVGSASGSARLCQRTRAIFLKARTRIASPRWSRPRRCPPRSPCSDATQTWTCRSPAPAPCCTPQGTTLTTVLLGHVTEQERMLRAGRGQTVQLFRGGLRALSWPVVCVQYRYDVKLIFLKDISQSKKKLLILLPTPSPGPFVVSFCFLVRLSDAIPPVYRKKEMEIKVKKLPEEKFLRVWNSLWPSFESNPNLQIASIVLYTYACLLFICCLCLSPQLSLADMDVPNG